MKIKIYVEHSHLENLYKFLKDGGNKHFIDYLNHRPLDFFENKYWEVEIDYNDFVILEDKKNIY